MSVAFDYEPANNGGSGNEDRVLSLSEIATGIIREVYNEAQNHGLNKKKHPACYREVPLTNA